MKKKQILTLVSILAFGALLMKGRALLKARQEAIENTPPPPARTMDVALIHTQKGTMRAAYDFNAQLVASRSIALSTRLSGYITDVNATEGQHVRTGDTLIRIDDRDIRSDIALLEKTLKVQKEEVAYAQRVYRSNIDVYKAGGLSKEKLEASRLAYLLKQSQLKATYEKLAKAKHQLAYSFIEAPFDGVIESVRAHRGDLAAPGRVLMTMRDAAQKVRFFFPPEQHAAIRPGLEVFYNDQKLGTIRTVYPSAQNGLSVAEVVLDKALPLPTGSDLPVTVYGPEQKGCIVPSNAVLYRKNGTYVIAYDAARKRFVSRKVNVRVSTPEKSLLEECFAMPLAHGSEALLSRLESYENVNVREISDAK